MRGLRSYELAAQLQLSAPEVLDISGETERHAKDVRARRRDRPKISAATA